MTRKARQLGPGSLVRTMGDRAARPVFNVDSGRFYAYMGPDERLLVVATMTRQNVCPSNRPFRAVLLREGTLVAIPVGDLELA